jgi:tetratricopeptide (TPR) repeat protein
MRRLFALAATALLGHAAAAQQPGQPPGQPAGQPGFPPQKLENLKVFPKDMPVRALLDSMGSFARALGVRCNYCHVGEEGKPLSTYNFKADEKPEKEKARTMLRMVAAINGDYLAKLPTRREPTVNVACVTCHRGVAVPRTLQQTLVAAYDAGGADSAEAAYKSLRQRYYGRAAYDFGEVALADVGAVLRQRGKTADALRFYVLNTVMSPQSAFAFTQAAQAQLAAGDTTAAAASLQKASELAPNDPQVKRMLDAIKKP